MVYSQKISGIMLFCGLVAACLSQSGCAKSAEERLIGRWYTDELTIRFREDNAVIWNSAQGLALGRYDFSGKVRKSHRKELEPNLFFDVIRNDRRQQFQFDVSFLGNERIKLHMLPIGKSVNSTEALGSLVLRRAEDDELLGGGTVKVARQ